MNCFEWQSRASDYLDGLMIGTGKKEADEHLDSCKECGERHKHYRQILESITSQRRSSLPITIRKSPLSGSAQRMDPLSALAALKAATRRSRWERTPWYIRTGIEGVGISLMILLVVSMVPRLRALYDRSVERRLDAFNMAELTLDDTPDSSAQVPLARGKVVAADEEGDGEFESSESESDSESDSSEPEDSEEIHVGASEVWRFSLKTDSPHEMRPKIVQVFTTVKIPAETPGFGGIEAPGGIQFDMLVPRAVVPQLKKELEKLMDAAGEAAGKSVESDSPTEPFTWYKTKSKKPIPAGKAHVVIWLSLS